MSKPNLQNLTPTDALMSMGALFLLILTISAVTLLVLRLAQPPNDYAGRTITVSATGDAYQTPDIAEFSYTVRKEGKSVSETQSEVTKQSNAVMVSLKAIGVKSEDIQTQNISANPKYEWQNKPNTCLPNSYCPPDGKNVLVGYESSVTTSVRIRDLDLAGKILAILGDANVSDIQGPQFTTDDPDKAMSEARNEALARARLKARDMATAMDVRLGRVVSFNENQGGGYPVPMYAGMEKSMSMDAVAVSAPTIEVQTGQNKVSVTVNVIYRIK